MTDQTATRAHQLDLLFHARERAMRIWHQAMAARAPEAYGLYDTYLRAKAAHRELRDSPLPDGEEAEVP